MKKTIRQLSVVNKKVFMRVDFNVPLDEQRHIIDDTRIQKTLPTIRYVLEQGGAVILASHLGRPKGKRLKEFSLQPVAERLSELLQQPVTMAPDCIGEATKELVSKMKPGDIVLLENLRFHAEEEKNDPDFAKQLAALGDIGVNDAFGCCHRAHASVSGIAAFLPMVAGLLLAKEIQFLGETVTNPEHPFAAIIGGAKISDKINVIDHLLDKVDVMIIGGGMANTFLLAQGYAVGKSLVEMDKIELAKKLLQKAKQKNVHFLLPVDVTVAFNFANDSEYVVTNLNDIPQTGMILDIGTRSQAIFAEALKDMKTIIWNGPMGVFEMPHFALGTQAVAKAVADASAVSIVGGGDSLAAINQMGLADAITHISTGGGASLEYLEGKALPGIIALQD
ncbi:phosphoglycerate kinase [Megasphaera hutchinsoni]|uniref:Phosphoglycerate kinase n=1 Tax=Megasphaera hutchinsoni TaxID=1588748 RepID=A0A134CFP4_9FIRM|nr:phosphoglycerate kinase [Megasphaera hutchinsoni]KXB90907.1 phosphoglycerate kinase [Megasphaera hutchinsoni]MUP59276.1 phosphoglycerate kinase [Veillonellaceae bacterium M2-4]